MSKITFAGLSGARARLQQLANGLRDAAGGGVLARAAAKVGEQVGAIAERVTSKHMATGLARASVAVDVSGGLVRLATKAYLKFHGWWPFRRGMPAAVVKNASIIFARELLAALSTQRALGSADAGLAADIVEEADAAASAKADAARERLDRAYDNRIKREEGREEKTRVRNMARERRQQERAAVRSREKYKRDNAKIYRQSAEGKAKRLAALKAARASRRAAA